MRWKRKILSQEQERKIEERVAVFEERTGAELVISIHRSSGPYPAAAVRFTLLFVVCLYALAPRFVSLGTVGHSAALGAIGVVVGTLLARIRAFDHLCWTKREIDQQVHERALKWFHLYRVHETTHRASCFFYISWIEKKFVLLVDKALAKGLPQSELEPVVAKLTGHFKNQSHESGLLESIDDLEKKFLSAFPEKVSRTSHANELKNSIRWGL